jgi:hypothetical protein
MPVILPPSPGDDVHVLAPPNSRLRGRVTGHAVEALTVELERALLRRPFRFAAGHEVDLEWLDVLGVVHVSARVAEAREEPQPTLELELLGAVQPVERREHTRHPVELHVWAWSLGEPSRRLMGKTVDLSSGGALLWLPELWTGVARIELTIDLPGWRLHASAAVRSRREPGLVGVGFERVGDEEQARLAGFLRQLR